ncbi:glycosyltransferase [Thalassobacillus hwangdonensis]|uniref:Glycosyltransferase n=1 Tax=Thalassobacillus hwangdonensis TaxID=546108 RepID=A0ABW3L2X3_9BACI
MKKKKVLFFIYQLGAGGAARTILNIVNNMDREKFTPILVTLDYNGSYESYLNEDVTFFKLKTKRLRSAILPLAKVIRRQRPDIVFSTIPNYNTIAILATVLSGTRAKNVVREAAYLGGTFTSDLKLRLYGLLYRRATRVIALSHGVKDNIVNRYKVKRDKITVIYNPVDLDTIEEMIDRAPLPDEHEHIFNTEEKVLITAGRMVNDKDHHTLLRAFARVNEKINARLVILGEGALEQELKQLADQLGIADKVFFLGFQTNPYLYFHHADAFVLSSKREGFGHVLAEALASGTPVISTNCRPGAVEVLDDGEYGEMCEVGNDKDMAEKITSILTLQEEDRAAIVRKGYKRANDFHAGKIAGEYEAMFTETIEQK